MNDMRKLMEAVDRINEESEYYDAADFLTSFDSELDEFLDRYWTKAEEIAKSSDEVYELHQKLEEILQSFTDKSIRG